VTQGAVLDLTEEFSAFSDHLRPRVAAHQGQTI
jgi:hypothetical protein